jgi:YVTN family beta-propeller protein
VTAHVPLTAHPNNMAVGKDGKFVYVGIIREPGGVDVIDTTTKQRVKNVPTKGTIHNVYVTPDGKYAVAGSIAGKTINVIDAKTNETAWTMDMDLGVRPMTFNTNPDGSTKWIFVQALRLQRFRGRGLRDAEGNPPHSESGSAAGQVDSAAGLRPVAWHGRDLRRENARRLQPVDNYLYSYSLPDLKPLGGAELSGKGAGWVTLTPDGKTAYVANPVTNDVSVVDVATMKETTRINGRIRTEAQCDRLAAIGSQRGRRSRISQHRGHRGHREAGDGE